MYGRGGETSNPARYIMCVCRVETIEGCVRDEYGTRLITITTRLSVLFSLQDYAYLTTVFVFKRKEGEPSFTLRLTNLK